MLNACTCNQSPGPALKDLVFWFYFRDADLPEFF